MFSDEELTQKFIMLTAPQAALRRFGVRADSIQKYRFEQVWHHQPLAHNWAATIGSWGGLKTNEELQLLSNTGYGAMKQFRQRHGLRTARKEEGRKESWDIALKAYQDYDLNFKLGHKDRVYQVAMKLGILPFELYLYVHEVGGLMKMFKVKDVMDFTHGPRQEIFETKWAEVATRIDMATTGTYAEASR